MSRNTKQSVARRRSRPQFRVSLDANFPFKLAERLIKDLRPFLPSGDEPEALLRACRARSYQMWDECKVGYSLQKFSKSSPLQPPIEVAAARQVGAVLDKVDLRDQADSRVAMALKAVQDAEVTCSNYNRKDYRWLLTCTKTLADMREFCSKVLGETLPEVDQLWYGARHGPGSVYAQELRQGQSLYQKYLQWPYSVTPAARQHAIEFISSDPLWLGALEDSYRKRFEIPPWCILDWATFWDTVLKVVGENRITTVRKDRLKDRPIAIEPTMNVMLQLGVDEYVRKRLKRKFRVNLNNQVINQELARSGSFDPTQCSPATIDLSSASDSVSLRIVKMLLPTEWYRYLMELRSPRGVMPDGTKVHYSKLSSMGNGYTFAIESLVFGAAVYAACKCQHVNWFNNPIHVYGDDIVVPEFLVPEVIQNLGMSGFSINLDKSFLKGHVKESCGTDWFRAYPVRPVYLRRIPRNLQELFHLHNSLWVWSRSHTMPLDNTLGYLERVIYHNRGGHFYGPPSDVLTDYWFNPEARAPYGIRKVMTDRKPTEWYFGKYLGLLRPRPPDLHRSVFDPMPTGSVFSDSDKKRWKYETYEEWPSSYSYEVRDFLREYHFRYLVE